QMRKTALVGTGEQVAGRLRELAGKLGVFDVVVNTWAHDRNVRARSYSLLAQAFQLNVEGPWKR
ncbi:MAG: LLM class flavin-dependent oxidoreductase, partial [Telluria sp.]